MTDATSCDVLAIDDEPVVRAAVRRILEPAGWRVETAADVAGAVTHPALATCRLLLCDVMLPDGSGLEVLRAARRMRSRLPVVLMTGYAPPDQTDAAADAGLVEVLSKPFEAGELLDVVRRALGATAEERTR